MILTIVGDVTAEQITGFVQTHFGGWKRPLRRHEARRVLRRSIKRPCSSLKKT
jgi:predicted Zn-dependent peptidase